MQKDDIVFISALGLLVNGALCLSLFAYFVVLPKVERAVRDEANSAVMQIEKDADLKIDVSGRDIFVSGSVSHPEIKTEIFTALKSGTKYRKIYDELGIEAPERPMRFSAIRDESALKISGDFPSAENLDAFLEKLPDETLSDLDVSRDAPEAWGRAVDIAADVAVMLKTGSVELSENAIVIDGIVTSTIRKEMLLEKLDTIAGALEKEVSVSIKPDHDYFLEIKVTDEGLRYDGLVPGGRKLGFQRDLLDLTSGLSAADRRSEDWGQAISNISEAMVLANDGYVRMEGNELRIDVATQLIAFGPKMELALSSLPRDIQIKEKNISILPVKPYAFAAIKSDDGFFMDGYIPNEQARAQIESVVGTDASRLKTARGAPDGNWARAIGRALGALQGVDAGVLEVQDQQIKFSGRVANPIVERVTKEILSRLPSGYDVTLELSMGPVLKEIDVEALKKAEQARLAEDLTQLSTCAEQFAAIWRSSGVRFPENSAKLSAETDAVFDVLSKILTPCLATTPITIEVSGLTPPEIAQDQERGPEARKIAFERALFIREKLINAGIDASRISAAKARARGAGFLDVVFLGALGETQIALSWIMR